QARPDGGHPRAPARAQARALRLPVAAADGRHRHARRQAVGRAQGLRARLASCLSLAAVLRAAARDPMCSSIFHFCRGYPASAQRPALRAVKQQAAEGWNARCRGSILWVGRVRGVPRFDPAGEKSMTRALMISLLLTASSTLALADKPVSPADAEKIQAALK